MRHAGKGVPEGREATTVAGLEFRASQKVVKTSLNPKVLRGRGAGGTAKGKGATARLIA